MTLRALELFCGIGGFAAAVAGSNVRVVGAVDQNPDALSVYRLNFPDHRARQEDLERISVFELLSYGADFWWLSPPCQPYTFKGSRRDLDDRRAKSLIRIMEVMAETSPERLPRHLALENVEGFMESQARKRLLSLLSERGYEIRERLLCPTDLGVPSRRPRYYLAASRARMASPESPHPRRAGTLADYLPPMDQDLPPELHVPAAVLEKYGSGFRILDPADRSAYTTCFTSGYGKSVMHAGSYLTSGDGVRYFAPGEIARFLHFPESFRFPDGMPIRKQWHLAGNSLSVVAVREVLKAFPEIEIH